MSAVQKIDDETKPSGIKVAQAVEKFRRLVIQANSLGPSDSTARTLAQLLYTVATCFNSAFEQVGSRPLSLFSEI